MKDDVFLCTHACSCCRGLKARSREKVMIRRETIGNNKQEDVTGKRDTAGDDDSEKRQKPNLTCFTRR